jgi:radical SAM/Cys-rich protein
VDHPNRNERPSFTDRLEDHGLDPLCAAEPEILQVNVGYFCNQRCVHCHIGAGPHRTEVMSREVMEACLEAWDQGGFHTVDVTGGAPELHPHLSWFLGGLAERGARVLVRTNLTVLVTTPHGSMIDRYADLGVQLVASLPCYTEENTDRQRGKGVYVRSVAALRRLNEVGYGVRPELELTLVYNPGGTALPGPQEALEQDYRRELRRRHGIRFTRLITMTNVPLGRFADSLESRGGLEPYLAHLAMAFNPEAVGGVMCRDTLSVGWDGTLYDCDFNQSLGWPVKAPGSTSIHDFRRPSLAGRPIVVGDHCYGCTAGAGSSCQGAIVC